MVKITGIFMWGGEERRSDRYGFVTVCKTSFDGRSKANVSVSDPFALAYLVNQRAAIKVTVLEARKSGHVGDLSRKIYPVTPAVGATFDLGVGTLRSIACDWSGIGIAIGLEPDDGRPSDWFNPRILYQLHDQTVEISIEASDAPKAPPRPEPSIHGFTMEIVPTGDGFAQQKTRRLSDVIKEKE